MTEITQEQKKQIVALSNHILAAIKKGNEIKQRIDTPLRDNQKLYDVYDRPAHDYYDKYGNNMVPLNLYAYSFSMSVEGVSNFPPADEALGILEKIGAHRDTVSDKPKKEGETVAEAMERSVGELKAFLTTHTKKIGAAQTKELLKNADALQQAIGDIFAGCERAKALRQEIINAPEQAPLGDSQGQTYREAGGDGKSWQR